MTLPGLPVCATDNTTTVTVVTFQDPPQPCCLVIGAGENLLSHYSDPLMLCAPCHYYELET